MQPRNSFSVRIPGIRLIMLMLLICTGNIGLAATVSVNGTGAFTHNDGMDITVTSYSGTAMTFHSRTAGGQTSSDVNGISGTTPERWSGLWRLDNSGSAGSHTVDITFDFSDYGPAITPSDTNYVLIFRSNGSGSGTAWAPAMAATMVVDTIANTVTFTGVTIPGLSDNEFTFGSTDPGASPLPVKLISFTATLSANATVTLAWATAIEVNNSHFNVERSTDGKHWTVVGTVPGHGTSMEEHSYEHGDILPLTIATTYYRLCQVDYNGDSEYSPVVPVRQEMRSSISLYPNPTADNIFLGSSTAMPVEGRVSIYTFTGTLVLETSLPSTGLVPTAQLPAGLYKVVVYNDEDLLYSAVVVRY